MAEARHPIRKRKFLWIIAAAFAVVVALTAASYALRARETHGGGPGVTDESIVQLSLASTVEQLSGLTGVEPWSETELCLETEGGAFEMTCFHWAEGYPHHVQSFSFHRSTDHPDEDGLAGHLRVALAHRLGPTRDGHQFSWGRAWLRLDEGGGLLSASVSPDDARDWPFQLELMWRICQAAIHNRDPEIEETTRRQWLGLGYPLATLAAVDLAVTVDRIGQEILAVVPAAVDITGDDLSRTPREVLIAVDHPWVADVRLHWYEPGEPVTKILLRPPHPGEFAADAASACLRDAMDVSSDRRGNTHFWRAAGLGDVRIHAQEIQITVVEGAPSPVAWASFLRAIDACAKEPAEAAP